MKKILFIIPHLSTGGLPQVVVNKVELLKSDFEVKCVEYDFLGDAYVVQKNRLIDLIGKENLTTLFDDKKKILNIIEEYRPDIISFEEFPEFFMSDDISDYIYKTDRKYTIIETTHDSSFSVSSKRWFPDKFIFVSAFNAFRYSNFDVPYEIIEYPIDKKRPNKKWAQSELNLDPNYKHVICVGLFTQRKNQGYLFDIAKKTKDKKILFHFIGNQADNFASYWKPLMSNKPDNCIIWGERKDVDTFLQACDIFFFPSKGDKNNKELNPIAIKEAISYDMKMMMFNLDVYCGKYDNDPNITFLSGNIDEDKNLLFKLLGMKEIESVDDLFNFSFEREENKIWLNYKGKNYKKYKLSIKEITSNAPMYTFTLEVSGGMNYFVIPIPTHVLKFYQNPFIRGLNIEFYTEQDEFVFNKEIIINDILPKVPRIDFEPFDCNYYNYYEFFAEKFFDGLCLNDLNLVVDIGANVGLFSKYLKYHGAKEIVLVEGNPNLKNKIEKVMGNDIENSTIIMKPVFSEKKITKFTYPSDNTTIGELVFGDGPPKYDAVIDVETTTIKEIYDIIGDKRISLFKTDIEGGEYELFKSMTDEEIKKVDRFLIEFHNNYNNEIKVIIDKLEKNGYNYELVELRTDKPKKIDNKYDKGYIVTY